MAPAAPSNARASELDLLFTIERNADQAPLALYVLLEHQSEPKRYMRLRLLKYCCRIWEQAEQEAGRLRAIVPVVLYQARLADLSPAAGAGLCRQSAPAACMTALM